MDDKCIIISVNNFNFLSLLWLPETNTDHPRHNFKTKKPGFSYLICTLTVFEMKNKLHQSVSFCTPTLETIIEMPRTTSSARSMIVIYFCSFLRLVNDSCFPQSINASANVFDKVPESTIKHSEN